RTTTLNTVPRAGWVYCCENKNGSKAMPMTCSICRHQQRALIEQALLENEPLRNIAKRFDCGYSSIRRHRMDHLPSAVADAYKAKQRLQDVVDVPQVIQERRSLTWSLLDRAIEPLTRVRGR